ncbi:DEAD/DEAH box helicase [Frigoribacterium salinisoli]
MLPLVDAVDIIRLVGPRPFGAGRDLARDGRVGELSLDETGDVLTARVQGSAPDPYVTRVELRPSRGDYSRPHESSCSCPIGSACKHVAATLLEANARSLAERSGGGTTTAPDDEQPAWPGGGPPGSTSAAAVRAGGTPTDTGAPEAGGASWRDAVAALSTPSSPASARATRLGLLFELRDRVRSVSRRFGGTASAAAASGALRLGVRPVSLSSTGNWVRGDLTWTSLPYQMNRLGIAPEQHAWFLQFAALHKSVHAAYAPGEGDWLHLDDFASPLLWPLLAEAERLGVALVTGKRQTDVSLAAEGRVTLDATRSTTAASTAGTVPGLRLVAGVTIDGEAWPSSDAGVIGDHGVWAARRDPALSVVLAPAPEPVGDEQRRLLTTVREIAVPADDEAEFVREALPALRRRLEVVSSDATVELPEALPPRLVLTAAFGRADTLKLAWRWRDGEIREPVGAHELPEGLVELLGGPPRDTTTKGVATAEFAATVLPALEARPDVDVEVEGTRPGYHELTEAPHLTITTVPSERRDWFDLGVLVTVEGRTVPYAPLLKALAKRQRKLLLVDKSYLSLAHPAFDELKRLIDEATELDEWEVDAPTISRYQAGLWSEFDQLADETVQHETWRATVGGLLDLSRRGDLGGVPSHPVPAGLRADLRPYQREGLDWLAFLYEHGLGGVLADDMGLGKTLQTLALVAHVREQEAREAPPGSARPFLVVAPTSVVANWAAEAARFTPGLVVRTVSGTSRAGRAVVREAAEGADVVVTSYALFRLDAAAYRAEGWAGLVLDEAQFVKNRASQAHRCAVELEAPFKLAITGTPLENGLLDLWSLFAVVAPGLLSNVTRFTEDYVKPLAGGGRPELMAQLRRRIRPLLLRRTKQMVAPELPEKQEQVLRVELDPSHRELYDTVLQRERLKLLDLIDDLDRHRFIVFRSLTLLRLLALDAGLVDEAYDGIPSAKLDQLLDDLEAIAAEGHRALVFSQFTTFLRRVAARLDERGIAHEYLDGSTRDRATVVDRFRSGDAPAFLISLKAGGFGLNLTEADYVFILDPWWNPAAEAQAVDRTHRIGQTERVLVQRLIATDTIEEKVLALQAQKSALFDAVVDDDAVFSAALTADDVRGLLEA